MVNVLPQRRDDRENKIHTYKMQISLQFLHLCCFFCHLFAKIMLDKNKNLSHICI